LTQAILEPDLWWLLFIDIFSCNSSGHLLVFVVVKSEEKLISLQLDYQARDDELPVAGLLDRLLEHEKW
jgi:hypothetical protein